MVIYFYGGQIMKEVSSIEEHEEYILNQTKLAISENDGLGDCIANALKSKIDEIVCSSYFQKIYERTFELRDSIKCLNITREAKEIIAEINHNLDLIHSYYPNQHHPVSPLKVFYL